MYFPKRQICSPNFKSLSHVLYKRKKSHQLKSDNSILIRRTLFSTKMKEGRKRAQL